MDISTLAQTLPAVAAIIFIVVKFLQHLKEERESFANTINNHMEHNIKEMEKLREVNVTVESTLKELCIYIKQLNGKKKK